MQGRERLQTISNLRFIACIAVGDVKNEDKNSLVIVTADGWCYIYENPFPSQEASTDEETVNENEIKETTDEVIKC